MSTRLYHVALRAAIQYSGDPGNSLKFIRDRNAPWVPLNPSEKFHGVPWDFPNPQRKLSKARNLENRVACGGLISSRGVFSSEEHLRSGEVSRRAHLKSLVHLEPLLFALDLKYAV